MPARLCAFVRRLVLPAVALLAAHAAGAGALPPPVAQTLTAHGIDPASVAVWVQAVDGSAPQLAHNADRPMNPASVMKLVTAFAALDRLGTDYTWTTRALSAGRLKDGVLQGDLYLVGSGDPVLSHERLWKLLRQLRAIGIDRVAGDIVLDGSALRLPPFDAHAFDGRGLRPYNAGAHGLLMNFNAVSLTLIPGSAPGAPVVLAAEPPVAGLRIENRIVSASGECDLWYGDLGAAVDAASPVARLVLSGSLPAACGRRDWNVAPFPTERYMAGLIAALWAEVGGRVEGRVRPGIAPGDAQLLIAHESPPLAEVVRDMNKWSNNVIARQLFAALGAAAEDGAQDIEASGAAAVRAQLEAAGIPTGSLVLENGAGLSRIERIRADSLGALLLAAWQRPWMPEFLAALPLAGVDGTARKRLDGSPVRGRAHIKTGTLDGVRAMAGYVLDRHSRRHVVVMIANGAGAAASQAAQDALLEWVWKGEDVKATP